MPVREFNGLITGGDRIVLGGTDTAIFVNDLTVGMLVYPLDIAADKAFAGFQNGTTLIAGFVDGGVGFSGRLGINTSTSFVLGDVGLTANEWQWIAFRRHAGGANPVRFTRATLDGSVTHATSGGTLDDNALICDRVELGSYANGGFGSPKHTQEATLFAFQSYLADEDLEALFSELSNQYIYDLSPILLAPINQASTSTPVEDVVGDADQVAIVGTTVIADNDPPGFDPAVTVVPPLQFSIRYSGGTTNADGALSIGGAESSYPVGSGLFPNFTNTDRGTGKTRYRLEYVHNDDTADGQVIAYLRAPLEDGRTIRLGVAAEPAGSNVTPIANDQTTPAGVTFSAPFTPETGVDLGVIPPGSKRGLWIEIALVNGTPVDLTNTAQIRFEIRRTE